MDFCGINENKLLKCILQKYGFSRCSKKENSSLVHYVWTPYTISLLSRVNIVRLLTSQFGLPWWLSWKRICLHCRRPGFDPWVGKIPWRLEWLFTPVSWAGEFHGLYSPRSRKESDTTEQLSLSLSFFALCCC